MGRDYLSHTRAVAGTEAERRGSLCAHSTRLDTVLVPRAFKESLQVDEVHEIASISGARDVDMAHPRHRPRQFLASPVVHQGRRGGRLLLKGDERDHNAVRRGDLDVDLLGDALSADAIAPIIRRSRP